MRLYLGTESNQVDSWPVKNPREAGKIITDFAWGECLTDSRDEAMKWGMAAVSVFASGCPCFTLGQYQFTLGGSE